MFNHDGRITLNHHGRVIVVTQNAASQRPDMRADRAVDVLNIGRRIARNRGHHSLGGGYGSKQRPRADEGRDRATDHMM